MKVLVASSLHSVDDPRVFHKEAASLARRYDIHLVAACAPAGDTETTAKGVRLHPFARRGGKLLGTFRAYREIRRCFRRVRPDVFHFHDPELVPLGLWLSLVGKCRVVYDIHEDVQKTLVKKRWLPESLKKPLGWLFSKLEMMATRRFAAAIVAEPYAMKRFTLPHAVLIRNYFPLFPDRARRTFDGRRPLRLIYVGSLTKMRGVSSLVEALNYIKTPAELLLVGKFHSEDFKRQALTGRPNVKYLGWVPLDRVFDYLHDADIGMNCVLPAPSHDEMLGTKVFDYMAARLPIITSNFSVWPEMIEQAGCGVCVDPTDVKAIARAVDELARNPKRLASMGDIGRRLFEEEYNWSIEEEKLFDLYSRLERGKGRKGETEKRTKGEVQSAIHNPQSTIRNPIVSVVIPMRNERESIEANLRALAANDLPKERFEVIIVDGMSEDGSAELAEALLCRMGNGRVIENSRRITPVALNVGVEAARGDVIIILGAHSAVFSDFLSRNLEVLERTGADCVGGTLIQVASDTLLANVINVAQNCPFGSGGAGFRYSDKPGYINTVPFGAYRREVFEKIGGFDEALYKGQDAEFNFRMVESGLTIYYSPEIKTRYFSRSSLRRLFKQFVAMGWSKVFVFYLHPRLLRAYYYLPLLFTIAVLAVLARLLFAANVEMLVYSAAALAYVMLSIAFGLVFARRKGIELQNRHGAAALFPICFFLMHFGYGLGIIKGLVQLAFAKGKRRKVGISQSGQTV